MLLKTLGVGYVAKYFNVGKLHLQFGLQVIMLISEFQCCICNIIIFYAIKNDKLTRNNVSLGHRLRLENGLHGSS